MRFVCLNCGWRGDGWDAAIQWTVDPNEKYICPECWKPLTEVQSAMNPYDKER